MPCLKMRVLPSHHSLLELFEAPAELTTKPDTVRLGPGEKTKISVRGTAPKGMDAGRMPGYEIGFRLKVAMTKPYSSHTTALLGVLELEDPSLSAQMGGHTDVNERRCSQGKHDFYLPRLRGG